MSSSCTALHSAYDAFEGFTGKPTDVIATLEDAVGLEGTVLMPSLPFTGTAVAYIAEGKRTDIRRTPSQMGIVTEVFRRQKGTRRSLHPTHPVLAKGKRADELIAGHETASTPCGDPSPFAKLPRVGAKILFLGTSIETMTFFHYLEEAYEAKLPVCPFTREPMDAEVADGPDSHTVTMRLFDPEISRKRRISRMVPRLHQRAGTRASAAGMVNLLVVSASEVEQVFADMIDAGESFYDG